MKIFSAHITGSKPTIIPAFSSDPSSNDIGDGSLWMNTSNTALKFSFQSGSTASQVWSAGGVKDGYIGKVGRAGNASNSALAFGGYRGPSMPTGYPSLSSPSNAAGVNCTQEYDGSSWTEGGNLSLSIKCNVNRGGAGSQNAALATGGQRPSPSSPSFNAQRSHDCTECYDGSSWTDASAALPHTRHSVGSVGTQNSAFIFGGILQPYGTNCQACKETACYNGSSWAACNNMINVYGKSSTWGTPNAAIAAGSCASPYLHTEEYDGTTWASSNAMPATRRLQAGFGTQNDGVSTGGGFPNNLCSDVYLYNGSVWSDGPSIATARYGHRGVGDSSNSGVIFSSYGTPSSNNLLASCTEEYLSSLSNTFVTKELVAKDGILSSSSDFAMFSADGAHRSGSFSGSFQGSMSGDGSGITGVSATLPAGTLSGSAQLSHDGFGNISGSSTSTGSFGRVEAPSIGTSISTIFGSGANLTNVATSNNIEITGSLKVQSTEPIQVAQLDNDPVISTLGPGSVWINKICGTLNFSFVSASILDKTWSAGGNFVGDRYCIGGRAFSSNDSIVYGGKYGNSFGQCLRTESYTYDGTTWTEAADVGDGTEQPGGTGTQNAHYKLGGKCCGPSYYAYDYIGSTEEYDGTSWSESVALGRCGIRYSAVGTQNSILIFAPMRCQTSTTCCRFTECWNGSAWASCNDMVNANGYVGGFGTPGAAAYGGGYKSPYACAEEWDGTSWASGNAINVARACLEGGGTQNAGLIFGGSSNNTGTCTESYNGTTWSATNAMSNLRCLTTGGGAAQGSILAVSSMNSNSDACTEEFTEGVSNTMLVKQITGSAHSY